MEHLKDAHCCGSSESLFSLTMWVVPKIGGTFFGVPIIRTIVFWGLYWGPLILGNYHVEGAQCAWGFGGFWGYLRN